MFNNFEKAFYEIKNLLLDSDDFKKLVFYNSKNTLSQPVPTYNEAEKSIFLKPIIYVYEDSPELGISTFVSIGILEAVLLEGSIQASIKVTVACDREVWEIDNNRVRPIAILSEIGNILDETKLSAAGKLKLKVIKEVFFNNDLIGYSALFDIDDSKLGVLSGF